MMAEGREFDCQVVTTVHSEAFSRIKRTLVHLLVCWTVSSRTDIMILQVQSQAISLILIQDPANMI